MAGIRDVIHGGVHQRGHQQDYEDDGRIRKAQIHGQSRGTKGRVGPTPTGRIPVIVLVCAARTTARVIENGTTVCGSGMKQNENHFPRVVVVVFPSSGHGKPVLKSHGQASNNVISRAFVLSGLFPEKTNF